MEPPQRKLTIKQKRFCEEYVMLGNAVQAYFNAYGSVNSKGVKRSYKSAARLSGKLIAMPHVQREIGAIQQAIRATALVTIEQLNLADSQAAFLDVRHFCTVVDGQVKVLLPHELPPEVCRCVAKFRCRRRTLKSKSGDDQIEIIDQIEYVFTDPLKARQSLAKRLGFDKPQAPLDQLLAALSPELRAKVWAELKPHVTRN